ncbi:hypothetical protein LJB87_02265 [Alistipes sp. OttesenSCG-928-L06]|nr:hypothetical protein [Alistipes sp. OttesenSCG-928-L06]
MQGIIKNKFTTFEGNKAEDVFLLIDVLSCPYVASNDTDVKQFRKEILDEIKFFDDRMPAAERERILDRISHEYSNMFFVWVGNDIGKELNTKLGHDVY